MKESPSQEDNSHSASQEILCLLWNPRVHFYFPKIQLNFIHPFPSWSSK